MTEADELRAPAAPVGTVPAPAPRISVLIPAYDAAATIGEALESVLCQSPPPFEVIVSDDGSRDDLHGVLRAFRSRVRLVRGPNAGLATARNRAAAIARGELLALLDADDVWLPGRTAALAAAASARPDLAVITTDAAVVRERGAVPERYYAIRPFPVEDQRMGILTANFVFGAGAVRADAFRAVGGYRPGARHAEDWDLWLRLLLRGHRAGLVGRELYEYRRRSDSLTGQRIDMALGVLSVLARARLLVTEPRHRSRLRMTEQEWRESAAREAIRLADPRGRRLALRAAGGAGAAAPTRLRFAAAALLPTTVVARRVGVR